MADHYNLYPMKQFAATVAGCMDLPLPASYAPPISWAVKQLKRRMGGPADRVVLYHADAVGLYIWQKYTDLFAPVYAHTSMALPMRSTLPPVTPVAHASMYTGLDPEGHGIQRYVRPKLECDTLFDQLIRAGKRVAILNMTDSTFEHIFAGRALDYFSAPHPAGIRSKALELIASGQYDVISIHTFAYDDAAHAYGPESKEAMNALSQEAEVFADLAGALEKTAGGHRTLLTYSPDHGQHLTESGRGTHGNEQIEDMNVVQFFGAF